MQVGSEAAVAQIAEEVNVGSDRKVSENTVHCSLLCMWLHSLRHSQGAHAHRCPPPKAPTMGTWHQDALWEEGKPVEAV